MLSAAYESGTPNETPETKQKSDHKKSWNGLKRPKVLHKQRAPPDRGVQGT